MTEFLKNNPIALHHCLLYRFLQIKSVKTAFADFRYVVGDDVIEKEEFEFKIDQFKQGRFDDNKQPIDNIVNILRNDKQALRVCVLYEWLGTRNTNLVGSLPVFAKYKNFCKVIGDNVMEYPEFEFWFYRFFNGEFDLNYERDKDKKIYELMDMPLDVMRNVVEYLDIFDRTNLGKTSRSLQTFVEDQKLFHQSIEFQVHNREAAISFSSSNQIKYGKTENGFGKSGSRKVKFFEEKSFRKDAVFDFKNILKNPKLHLEDLQIACFTSFEDETFEELECFLKKLHLLRIKSFSLRASSCDQVLKILPFLKPEYLVFLNFYTYENNDSVISKIIETEQWKQAKYFTTNKFSSFNRPTENSKFLAPLHHLYHFERFTVRYRKLNIEDIREMKEILFKSPNFEYCDIMLDDTLDLAAIGQEFGDAIPGSPNTYHYPILNSTDYFKVYLFSNRIVVNKCKY